MKLTDLAKYYGKKDNYTEPSSEQIKIVEELTRFLVKEQNPLNMSTIEFLAGKLNLKMVEILEKKNNYAFYDENVGPLFFVWSFNEMLMVKKTLKKDLEVVDNDDNDEGEDGDDEKVENIEEDDVEVVDIVVNTQKISSPSILCYPHAGSDNVEDLVINLFLQGSHKALIINGMSIASTNKKSSTQPKKTKCNVDHSYDNLMNYFINFINLKFPEIVFLNLHGMTSKPDVDLWAINSLSGYNTKIRNYPILFSIAAVTKSNLKLQTNFNFKGFTFRNKPVNVVGFEKSGPTSSVIGKVIHSGSLNPKAKIMDTGNYIHCEHSITFAKKSKNALEISRVHNVALQYYLAWNSTHKLDDAPKELEKFESWLLGV